MTARKTTDPDATDKAAGGTEKATGDAGEQSVQKKFDEAHEKGVLGTPVDPTPNEHYTLQGVIAGKPTPETDADALAAARAASSHSRG